VSVVTRCCSSILYQQILSHRFEYISILRECYASCTKTAIQNVS
jgi:hypothetical protein